MSQNIFREEYLKKQKQAEAGQILLLSGINQTLVTLCCIIIISVLLAFLTLGEYTKKVHLKGVVIPSTGLISVRSSQSGVIKEIQVDDGIFVERSDDLFTITNELFDRDGVSVYHSLNNSLTQQYHSLSSQRDYEALMSTSRTNELNSKINRLQIEADGAKQSLLLAKELTTIKQQANLSYKKLREKNYISELAFKDYQSSLVRLQAEEETQRMLIRQLEREIISTQHQLDYISLQGNMRSLELSRQLDIIQQQKIELDSGVETTVLSPVEGEVATVRVEKGQTVRQQELVMDIIPSHALMQVELYAPNRAIGFVKEGQEVGLRFDAFPYEKFGIQKGKIKSISKSTLSPQELRSTDQTIRSDQETLYRIVVELQQYNISVYGEEKPFKVGMSVIADIRVETRHLYEWLLGPITRIQGISQ
ncbi:HlyD family secretion protein [Vibrio cionasavignyae]|uniref:HlyD family secretion protein n=1 Tax=Vibrio cionasavignyae TaxID=2910252 RepID=UPI003D0D7490